jgi:rod shape determining protein RodA
MLYVISSRVFGVGISLPFAPWINGAFSWISLSIASFQPSEFIKIVLIVMVSMELNKFYDKYPNPTPKEEGRLALRLARFVLPPLILIFIQPDTGVCIIIVFTLLVLLMCSGMRKQYVWAVVGAVLFVFAAFFYLYFRHQDVLASVVSAYRLQRIEAWLDPESYILGSSNQLYTALLSLGSAGLSGYGLQANIIAIPEAHTDFIFAAFGQCFGFVGTVFILAVCILLDLYLCRIAYNTKNRTDRLITIGVVAMLFYQQMQNLGMIVGLVPITGITLPLISYGGRSTVSYFIAFGIILNGSPLSKKKINVLKKKAEAQ